VTTTRLRLAAAVAVVLVPALAGCSTNFSAQTDQVYNPSVGSNARGGEVEALGVTVVSGSAGTGTLSATLVSNSDKPESLSAVTIGGASATINGSGVTVQPRGNLNLSTDGNVRVTGGDTSTIVAGKWVDVQLTFTGLPPVTVKAPVVRPTGDYASVPVG
jgi:copper(I)-binding protein